ncbi:CD225/dispanin family protein [Gordonia caeni]|uniref:Interferon-induced transmembrane protein n=1 Tax=Gordonia caeni TaxID=1007097 RepID=A0ABP7NYI2_9ACTN
MTTPQDPDRPSGGPDQPSDEETTITPAQDWSSYEPTVVAGGGADADAGGADGPLPPQAYPGYPNPYAEQQSVSQPEAQQPYTQQPPYTYPYAQPQPYAPQPYAYVPPPSPQAVFASQGAAPQTGQVSAIVALVVGAMLLVSCYGTLAGIAPTVLGILGIMQANSVNRSWMAGQIEEARQAAEGSKKKAMWAWISMAIGVLVTIVVVVILIVVAIQADGGSSTGYST